MHSEDSGGMRITNYGCSSFPTGKVNYFLKVTSKLLGNSQGFLVEVQ